MRAMFALVLTVLAVAAARSANAQEFASGWELVVKQHPTEADPGVVLECWAWTERRCEDAQMLVAGGALALVLSHPVVAQGWFEGHIDCHLEHFPPTGPPQPYCPIATSGRWIEVRGTVISPFNFAQTLLGGDVSSQTLYYDNPLHVMDIDFALDDLTPRDLVIETSGQVATSCVQDGMATGPISSPIIIEDEVIVRVSGGACPADFDADGSLTVFDFLAFQNAFAAGELRADYDGDGELTVFDFQAFQNEFEAGCP